MLVSPFQKVGVLALVVSALSASAALAGQMDATGIKVASVDPVTRPLIGTTPLVGANGARPDTAALRYYATRGEQGRVQAEIRRLKQLYPGWQQPENIFSDQSSDEKQLWGLFSTGKYSELKQQLASLKIEKPEFVPSPELLTKLEAREQRTAIAMHHQAGAWSKVIEGANANPELLMGEDVELLWFVANAYARLERPADALEAYTAAFTSSRTKQERKATMQKAATALSTQAALTLLDSTEELSTDEVLKGEIEDAVVRGALARSAETGEELPAILVGRIKAFEARARMSGLEQDAVLLAWSNFGRSQWKEASKWFAIAGEKSNDPKVIEGGIMSAKRAGELAKATTLATKWQDTSPEIGALYLGLTAPSLLVRNPEPLPGEFLQGYSAKTVSLKSGEGAEALGWYAYNVKQLDAAKAWFAKASEWELTETSVLGQALTAQRLKDRATFDMLKASYDTKFAKIAALKFKLRPKRGKYVAVKRRSTSSDRAGKLRGKIASLYKAKRYGECLRLSRTLRTYGPLKGVDHQMRGWCLLGAKRPAEAERAFAAAVRMGGKGKTPSAFGQSLAALRSGKTNEALDIASSNRLTAKQRKTVDVELLTQRARAAFNNQDYAASVFALNKRSKLVPETRDLTLMRAWAHHHTGQSAKARQIFAMLDAQLSTRETRRGLGQVDRKRNAELSHDGS